MSCRRWLKKMRIFFCLFQLFSSFMFRFSCILRHLIHSRSEWSRLAALWLSAGHCSRHFCWLVHWLNHCFIRTIISNQAGFFSGKARKSVDGEREEGPPDHKLAMTKASDSLTESMKQFLRTPKTLYLSAIWSLYNRRYFSPFKLQKRESKRVRRAYLVLHSLLKLGFAYPPTQAFLGEFVFHPSPQKKTRFSSLP